MELDKFISDRESELHATVNFKEIEIDVSYGSKVQLAGMLNKSKRIEYRNHQPVEEYNDDVFMRQIAQLIVGWRGFTLGKLSELTNVTLLSDDDPAEIIPCTSTNKFTALKTIYGFDTFIRDTVLDIDAFRQEQIEKLT